MQQGFHNDSPRSLHPVPTTLGTHAVAWGAAGVLSLGLAGPVGLIGCAGAPSRTQANADQVVEPVSAELPPPASRRRPERVVFSDEPDPGFGDATTDAQSLAQGMPGDGPFKGASGDAGQAGQADLVEALAGTYEEDMKALAAMQSGRTNGRAAADAAPTTSPAAQTATPATTPATTPAATQATTAGTTAGTTPSATSPLPTATPRAVSKAEPAAGNMANGTAETTVAPTGGPTATQPPVNPVGSVAPAGPARPAPGLNNEAAAAVGASGTQSSAASAATPVSPQTTVGSTETVVVPTAAPTPSNDTPAAVAPSLANATLELPPDPAAAPTDPVELTRLLAESLAKRGASSTEPTRDWLAYAALAIGEPSLSLPKDFGSDLLPAERERIEKVHTAFAAVGRLLAQGGEIDQATAEGLVAALTGGPKLEIPKVEFCTKVESFGRFAPLGSDRFLARSNARFILYTELSGFSSELEDGEFVTRLATRVSIESERDGIEVWARQPAWTAVVDRSPTRRADFFVGEIVSVSEYLSVGSYRLKIEIRDEASGRVTTAHHPLHIVADPSMAAVGD